MNIKDLEYLVSLAEHRHFKKAAVACHVSQPTLSGQIKKLELELGIMLLERTSRKVLFTESGLSLVEQSKKILNEVKVFKEMAHNQHKQMEGPLNIGIIPTVGPYILPYMLPEVKNKYPKIDLFISEMQTEQIIEDLNMGKLDCAILSKNYLTRNFVDCFLYNEPLLLTVGNKSPLAKKKTVQLKEIQNLELILLEKGNCLRDDIISFCADLNFKENHNISASSIETIKNIVSNNFGMALLPQLSVCNQDNSNLSFIKVTDPEPFRDIVLIYRPGSALKGRYEKLAELIRDCYKNILS